MSDGVMLDTSFLIAFANPRHLHHAVARQFWDHFVAEGILMYLSTIAVAEFQQGQDVTDLPLDAIIILPFNFDDAREAAKLDFTLYKGEPGVPRVSLKDDFKLLGQAKAQAIAFLITGDARTLFKYCQELRAKGMLPTRPIKLDDGFDRSHFDPTLQHDFEAALTDPPIEPPITNQGAQLRRIIANPPVLQPDPPEAGS